MPYYVVKKYEPGEIFAAIITWLVVAALIAVLAIYVGLIVLAIIGIIAGGTGLIYSLILYIRAFIQTSKRLATTPKNLKEFYVIWNTNVVDASKAAFKENINQANYLYNRQKVYRFSNPLKSFMLFLSLFLIVIGSIFVVAIALIQYLFMALVILSIGLVFALMVVVSTVISIFISFGFGVKYLAENIGRNRLFGALKPSTYSHFRDIGGEIGDYWSAFKLTIADLTSDMKSHAQKQWGNVGSYVFYSPLKYYYCASPIGLYFNIGIVTALFAIFAAITFIILLIIKLVCCVITAIMRH